MARTATELTALELLSVEELAGISNNKVPYKNNSGVYAGAALGASGTVLTSNGATSAPTFEVPASSTPTAITVANEATDTTCFPAFFTAATGDLGPKTNAGLTFNSNTGALGMTTIELGHASDTTLSRSSAGVMSVEGVVIDTVSAANTITNKRNQPRIVSAASYTTDTGTSLDFSTCDIFIVTAQAGALLFNNPSGTPQHGEKMMIRIKDNGTARALTYDSQYRAIGITLPTTTVISKTLYIAGIWNTTDTKLDILAVGQEA